MERLDIDPSEFPQFDIAKQNKPSLEDVMNVKWDDILDGSVWKIYHSDLGGYDFDQFRHRFYLQSYKRNHRSRTRVFKNNPDGEEDYIVVQAMLDVPYREH